VISSPNVVLPMTVNPSQVVNEVSTALGVDLVIGSATETVCFSRWAICFGVRFPFANKYPLQTVTGKFPVQLYQRYSCR
jgi:hypothetical protein